MRSAVRVSMLCGTIVLLAACTESPAPTAQPATGRLTTQAVVSSASAFAWLAPTVRETPPTVGSFLPNQLPLLHVRCVGNAGSGCPTVAQFDRLTRSRLISVNAAGEYYQATWAVPSTLTPGSTTYRLEVLEGSTLIGDAPLHVVPSAAAALALPGTAVAVVPGSAFTVRFRLAQVTTPADQLPGDVAAPAAGVVANQRLVVNRSEYETANPIVPGLPLSNRTLLVSLTSGATVGDVNALLQALGARVAGGVRGVPGAAGALLMLRLPSGSWPAMQNALALLRTLPSVRRASPDVLVAAQALPRQPGTPADGWTWEVPSIRPGGGNWSFERARIPQMWNLNDIIARDGVRIDVAVWEPAPVPAHSDLSLEATLLEQDGTPDVHGLSVAGFVAATHDNGGVDGVTRFARLYPAVSSSTASAIAALPELVQSGVRVVNASWGRDYLQGQTPAAAPAAAQLADDHGAEMRDAMAALVASGAVLPQFVVSTGNDSRTGAAVSARYAGALQNAAVAHGVAAITLVEALEEQLGGGLARRSSSNVDGHVSIGGSDLTALGPSNGFITQSGTSFAAPQVAGLMAQLYATYPALARPTLSENPVRALLLATARPVAAGTAPHVDAFAAAMRADGLASGERAIRGLVDIDDGTPDGNTRVVLATNAVNAVTTLGGDGRVTMRDFRRWRDWLLQVEPIAGVALNGSPLHIKKDPNLNGRSESPEGENVFPRGDFNGDGVLSLNDRAVVPGVLANANLTDLEVMQRRWDDALYDADELDALLNSGDVEVSASQCVQVPGTASVRLTARRAADSSIAKQFLLPAGDTLAVITVAPGDYFISKEALSASGTLLAGRTVSRTVAPGSDARMAEGCGKLTVTVGVPAAPLVTQQHSFSVVVTLVDPVTQVASPVANLSVNAAGTNAALSGLGRTNASGVATGVLSLSGGAYTVTASATFEGQTASGSASGNGVTTLPPQSFSLLDISGYSGGRGVSPLRLIGRLVNVPGAKLRWSASARSNGTVFAPGDQSFRITSTTTFPRGNTSPFTVDEQFELTYGDGVRRTSGSSGISIAVRACVVIDEVVQKRPGTTLDWCNTFSWGF